MMWRLVKLAMVLGVLFVTAVFVFMLIGPRMKDQPNIRTYQSPMPMPPKGSVAITDGWGKVPTTQQAMAITNPVPASAANIARGKTYYQYYCAFCHGDAGGGDGPVAQAYVPVPSDLRAPRVRALSDGQLYRAMLTAMGHEPVMETTVLPEHRWYVVLYVRYLAGVATQP
jgi:mono/diheme cytochrome c family protein